MSTYVILSRIMPGAMTEPSEFAKMADTVSAKIKEQCPTVTWRESYATMGQYDVVDIVESPDLQSVERAAMIIRSYGKSTTETLACTPWKDFLNTLRPKAGAGRATHSNN